MGCTQSKIENEEAVTRCKDRKQFMKEAVSARNAFAAAQSAYTMSLKNTGAALSDYAHGEVQNPQHIPLNHHHTSPALPLPPSAAPPPPMDRLVPPPPPPEPFPPIQRATSLPAINLSETKEKESKRMAAATIVEEENEEEMENSQEKLITRKRSSGRNRSAASSATGDGVGGVDHQSAAEDNNRAIQQHNSAWDYFFPSMENMPGPTLEVKEEKEVIEQKVFDEMPKRAEEEEKAAAEAEMKPPVMEEEKRKVVEEEVESPPPPPSESDVMVGRSSKKGKAGGGVGGMVEKRGGKGGANLLQVFVELDDLFLKAYESAHEVSKMMEATRLHYHSNFADNRGNSLVEDWFSVPVNEIWHEFVKNKEQVGCYLWRNHK